MSNCIFCKIVNEELPSTTIYEDEKFRVILDLSPATKGHALILVKEHYTDIYDIPEELVGDIYKLAARLTKKMTAVLGCDGFNLVQNNKEAAGQTVRHFHVHLIPRYENDEMGLMWEPGTLTDEVRAEILEKMKED